MFYVLFSVFYVTHFLQYYFVLYLGFIAIICNFTDRLIVGKYIFILLYLLTLLSNDCKIFVFLCSLGWVILEELVSLIYFNADFKLLVYISDFELINLCFLNY